MAKLCSVQEEEKKTLWVNESEWLASLIWVSFSVEVLRCSLAHNRCHNLNYYHQSFTPPVKRRPDSQSYWKATFMHLLKHVSVKTSVTSAHCTPPTTPTHLEHMAALFYNREFTNICRQTQGVTNINLFIHFPTSYSLYYFHVLVSGLCFFLLLAFSFSASWGPKPLL